MQRKKKPHHADYIIKIVNQDRIGGFPGGLVVKNPLANAGNLGSDHWSGN